MEVPRFCPECGKRLTTVDEVSFVLATQPVTLVHPHGYPEWGYSTPWWEADAYPIGYQCPGCLYEFDDETNQAIAREVGSPNLYGDPLPRGVTP